MCSAPGLLSDWSLNRCIGAAWGPPLPKVGSYRLAATKSVLGIPFTFWVMGFLIYEQKGSLFLPKGTGIKAKLCILLDTLDPKEEALVFVETLPRRPIPFDQLSSAKFLAFLSS